MLKLKKGIAVMHAEDKSSTDYLVRNKQTNMNNNYTQNEAIKVEKQPPMNPSHVFFGDNSINGVLPNETPKIYAIISLVITKEHGKINQTMPNLFKIFYLQKYS